MDEAEFRSPREEVTTDDYSSDDDSQPSTSDYSPDRNQQHASVSPPLASADQRNLSQQRRPVIPMLGLKLPGKDQQHAQPPTLPVVMNQIAADTAPETAPSGSTTIPVLQLTKSLSRNTDSSSSDQPAPARSLSRLHSQRSSSRQSPRLLYTVQLASAALSVNAPTLQRPEFKQLSRLEAVRQHCATELGIRQSAIRLYQLQEVTELTDSCVHLAVAVEGSGLLCGTDAELPTPFIDAFAEGSCCCRLHSS